jgi:hypothetical protein
MDWVGLAQDRDKWKALMNKGVNHLFPENAGKFLSSCKIGGVSKRAQFHTVG